MKKWIPIDQFIENDHQLVNLLLPNETCRLCVFLDDVGFEVDGPNGGEIITNATHFWPLPDSI